MGLTATTAAAIKQLAAQEAEQLAPLEAAHVRELRTYTSALFGLVYRVADKARFNSWAAPLSAFCRG